MTIQEAHYQFKLNKDRIDTLATEDFNAAEIDWLLNEAQMVFVKQRLGTNNNKRKGFEAIQKRIDDLAKLVIKYPLQPAITPSVVDPGIYEVSISSLVYTYLQLISGYATVKLAEDCIIEGVPLKFMQHDDYRVALRDPFNEPSTEFIPYNTGRSTNGSGTSIYLYGGQLPNDAIQTIYLEYIKYPSKVSLGTYTYIDGVVYPATTFELSDHTHQEIVDIACQLAAINTDNPEYIQLKNMKISVHE